MSNFVFFGSDDVSIEVLKALLAKDLKPDFCITQPDKRAGRNMELTPPPIKNFCTENNIKVLQPDTLNNFQIDGDFDFFVVASYGKIIPKEILDIPKKGVLNVHPSLLPKYRGATPIESVILNDDKETGVTIMLMDEKMDHGAIIAVEKYTFDSWPSKAQAREILSKIGGKLLVEIIPNWLEGKIKPIEQNHNEATYTKLIQKSDGEILNSDSERQKYLKYLAYTPWPGVFFFTDKKTRIKITQARFEEGKFIIEKVIPEGKKEMDWQSFQNGYLI